MDYRGKQDIQRGARVRSLGRMSDEEYEALWKKIDRGDREGRDLRRLTDEEYEALTKEIEVKPEAAAELKKKFARKYRKKNL